jgi:hypothetical protein
MISSANSDKIKVLRFGNYSVAKHRLIGPRVAENLQRAYTWFALVRHASCLCEKYRLVQELLTFCCSFVLVQPTTTPF